jgi:hypothetical protein
MTIRSRSTRNMPKGRPCYSSMASLPKHTWSVSAPDNPAKANPRFPVYARILRRTRCLIAPGSHPEISPFNTVRPSPIPPKKRNKCLNKCSTFPLQSMLNCFNVLVLEALPCPPLSLCLSVPLSLRSSVLRFLPLPFAPLPLRVFALNLFAFHLHVLGVCAQPPRRRTVVQFPLFQRHAPVFPPCKCRNWQAAAHSLLPAVWCQSSASLPCGRRRILAVLRQPPVLPPG